MKKFFLFMLGAFLISTSLWAKELVQMITPTTFNMTSCID